MSKKLSMAVRRQNTAQAIAEHLATHPHLWRPLAGNKEAIADNVSAWSQEHAENEPERYAPLSAKQHRELCREVVYSLAAPAERTLMDYFEIYSRPVRAARAVESVTFRGDDGTVIKLGRCTVTTA